MITDTSLRLLAIDLTNMRQTRPFAPFRLYAQEQKPENDSGLLFCETRPDNPEWFLVSKDLVPQFITIEGIMAWVKARIEKDEEGEEKDSCWGYIGDYRENILPQFEERIEKH